LEGFAGTREFRASSHIISEVEEVALLFAPRQSEIWHPYRHPQRPVHCGLLLSFPSHAVCSSVYDKAKLPANHVFSRVICVALPLQAHLYQVFAEFSMHICSGCRQIVWKRKAKHKSSKQSSN